MHCYFPLLFSSPRLSRRSAQSISSTEEQTWTNRDSRLSVGSLEDFALGGVVPVLVVSNARGRSASDSSVSAYLSSFSIRSTWVSSMRRQQ